MTYLEISLQNLVWHPYYHIFYDRGRHSVSGNLQIARDVYSPQLQNQRDLIVYLPPSYEKSADKRYPVLYMHDGYNLFDNATSYAEEWYVDEIMEKLGLEENAEAIVVGIPNMGTKRLDEYSPFVDAKLGGGHGHQYIDFICNTIKPLIDRDFRTLQDKKHTGIMGSSMGGLISLYGFFSRPAIFGFAGVMSPSLWFANDAIFRFAEETAFQQGKIYLDAGTREMGGSWPDQGILRSRSRRYYGRVRRLKRILVKKGYRPRHTLLHVEGQGDGHNEAAWAQRLPNAIRFFLGRPLNK